MMSELVFERRHALEAMRQAKANGREWLYQTYPKSGGRSAKSRTAFVLCNGTAYPMKPLGRLANALAGRPTVVNDHTVAFRAHFEELGFALTKSAIDEAEKTATSKEARETAKRQRRQAEIWARPGQAKFRREVFDRFGARCLVTGCETLQSLEAAHVVPVADGGRDTASNGIPLRADIHRLFDADAISIDPDKLTVIVCESVLDDYGKYKGRAIGKKLPDQKTAKQLSNALRKRRCSHGTKLEN